HIDPDEIKNTKVKNQEASIVLDSLEVLARDIKTKADFTVSLEEGDLEKDFDCSSDDKLGSALLSLRSNLKSARVEAEKRQWTNEGLTKFSAILRDHSNNFEKLCSLLISELVRYMGTNQGSIFLLKEEEDESERNSLQLISTYAFDRKKFIKKEVSIEDGLIGQSFQEKATIHLTEIPEDYISITSGLGQAVPKVLLIVPLKVELEVNGIIEMAGFRPFKDYEIDFIEKLAESISLTIKNSQTNEATRKLLRQSQIQAEELKSAEEEMRQNMEELQTTQEELNRRAKETETLLKNTERKGELSNLQIEISNLLSSANSTDQVYQTVIKEIGEKLNFKFACGYATGLARGKRVFNSLKTVYSRNENLHQSYITTVLDSVIPITQDLLGVVYESKEAKFFDNFSELEIFTRREEALNAKLYSVYLFPIAIGKKVSGILEFYSDNGLPEDPNITEFGVQMGQQLGEILSRVKMSEATMVNEEAMAKWQFDMRAIVDGLPVSMIVIDENGKVENNNKNYITMMNLNILTVAKESFYSYVGDKTIKFESGNTYKTTLTPVGGEPINVSIKVQEIKKNEGMRNLLLIDKLE
ncbi:MAG: GAF domain-containing protein, partial [Cyclobacteriaceae bacterium]|nr:GAF domain-containing protein [Cyclobacteriaceae bacterium]